MAAHSRPDEAEEESDDAEPSVRVHETCPGRVVFTEDGNTDAWIASDLTLDRLR